MRDNDYDIKALYNIICSFNHDLPNFFDVIYDTNDNK